MAQSRQLAAIMFTDIVGYTALMEQDEKRAFAVLKENLRIHQSAIDAFGGKLVKELGDGILASFPTVTDALNAAINIQKQCNDTNEFKLSIGIHEGEVLFENGDIFGDAVNVASRIQSIGTSCSVLFSKRIADEIKNKHEFQAVSLGSFEFKNVNESIEVFALANDGFTVPQRNKIEGKLKKRSQKRTVIAVLAMALLLLAAYFIVKISYPNNDKVNASGKSIAVLPFQNMSNDPDQEYFSDGMTDQIITSLAKLKVLHVIGRTSMMHYKGTKKTIPEIAKELNNVAYVLEGSIQKSGKRIKVNVQLIRAKDNFHQWAEVYVRDLTDIFTLQDELSKKIAETLLGELPDDQKKLVNTDRPTNAEAYEYYLKGLYLHGKIYYITSPMEDYQAAEKLFLKAISLDPGYANAYAALADLYDTRGHDPAFRKYRSLRDSVLRIGYKLNPRSLYVLFTMGVAYHNRPNPNMDSAFYYYHQAYKSDSVGFITTRLISRSVIVHLMQIGLYERATPILQKLVLNDPLDVAALANLAMCQQRTGDIKNAGINMKKVLEVEDQSLFAISHLAYMSIFFKKDFDSANKAYQRILKIAPDSPNAKNIGSILLAHEGKKKEALALSRHIGAYSFLKMKKEAIQRLDSLIEIKDFDWGSYHRMRTDKALDFIRSEPEFQRLLLREKKIYEERLAKYGHMFE